MDDTGEFWVEKVNVKSRETSLKASKIVAASEASSSECKVFGWIVLTSSSSPVVAGALPLKSVQVRWFSGTLGKKS